MLRDEQIKHRELNSINLKNLEITSWNRVDYKFEPKLSYGLEQKAEIINEGALLRDIEFNDFVNDERLGLDGYLVALNKTYVNSGFYIESTKTPSKIRVSYKAELNNPHIIDYNRVIVKEGQKLSLVLDYNSIDDLEALRNSIFKIEIQENAELELVFVQRLGAKSESFGNILVDLGNYAKLNQYFIDLGGFVAASSNKIYLGESSTAQTYSIYLADKERKIDLEYSNFHKGRRSESLIEGRGIVKDKAKKVFRGNLKFERGSTKSVGKEAEYAILLSKDVKASSIPTLKCDEDDVIGEHAASAGQIDRDKLFYLTSRGLSPKEAERLVVLSNFKPILEKIGNKDLENIVLEEIEKRV